MLKNKSYASIIILGTIVWIVLVASLYLSRMISHDNKKKPVRGLPHSVHWGTEKSLLARTDNDDFVMVSDMAIDSIHTEAIDMSYFTRFDDGISFSLSNLSPYSVYNVLNLELKVGKTRYSSNQSERLTLGCDLPQIPIHDSYLLFY